MIIQETALVTPKIAHTKLSKSFESEEIDREMKETDQKWEKVKKKVCCIKISFKEILFY